MYAFGIVSNSVLIVSWLCLKAVVVIAAGAEVEETNMVLLFAQSTD